MAKIMIVEDDPMLVEIYDKKLTDAGFETKVVTSGKAVQEEVNLWQPDLMLLDIVLPDMDGFEILENLSKNAVAKKVAIYVFSNLSSREDIDRATSLGAKGFLTKSNFTPTQLVEEIKKLVGSADAATSETTPKSDPEKSISRYDEHDNIVDKKEKNGRNILIIEDEDIFIEMFGDKLKQEGFEVTSAKNGRWGLREAEKGGFDCILLDMMMPAMNGFEAIQELRSNENTKNTPIIILSNSAQETEMKRAVEMGANEYYVKTLITPGEVAEKVKELINK